MRPQPVLNPADRFIIQLTGSTVNNQAVTLILKPVCVVSAYGTMNYDSMYTPFFSLSRDGGHIGHLPPKCTVVHVLHCKLLANGIIFNYLV